MTQSNFWQPEPTFALNPFIDSEGLSMTDHMTVQYLSGGTDSASRIDYLDLTEYLSRDQQPQFPTHPSTEMDIEADTHLTPNQHTFETSIEDNQFFASEDQQHQTPQRVGRGPRSTSNTPKRDYSKNITKNVVQSCCRKFQNDVLAQKVVKKKCQTAEVPYSNFMDLIKQILKEYHISNRILLKKYLAPSESDPQFAVKCIFVEYFNYFLNNSLTQVAEQSSKVKDLSAYIEYSRKFLVYLGTKCVNPNICYNNRM